MKGSILSIVFGFLVVQTTAQNVAINTDGSSAHNSSILDVKSNNKGILLPRMNSAERNAIVQPEKGLLVFDNDKSAFMYFDGIAWRSVMGGNNAQSVTQELTTPAGESSYALGYEITGDGDYIAVSSIDRPGGANDFSGAVHLFRKTATGAWVWHSKLTAPTPTFYDYFGFATDMDGDYLVVGSPRKKNAANLSIGYAYIYKRNGNAWTLETTLTRSNAQENDFFGHDVAITTTGPGGVYAAISAPGVDIPESNAGQVALYRKEGAGWVSAHTITSANFKANDQTGFSIDIEGDLLVVGAPFKDATNATDAGAAYYIRYSALAWQQEWMHAAFEQNLAFGYSVSVSGTTVALGAPSLLTGQGRVYYDYRNGSAWDTRLLTPPHSAYADGLARFGLKVSLQGTHLLVGASGNRFLAVTGTNIDGDIPGRAYLYNIRQGSSGTAFGLRRTFESAFADNNDQFANSVLLNKGFYFIADPRQSKPDGYMDGSFLMGTYQ